MTDHQWLAEFGGDDLTREEVDALSDRIARLAAHLEAAADELYTGEGHPGGPGERRPPARRPPSPPW